MNTNLLNIVNRIVAEQGEGILADAKRLFPYFSNYAKNEHKEERVAFGRCIEMGAYQELKRTRTPDERQRIKATLATQMNANTGIARPRCVDALDLLEAVIFKPQQPQYPPQQAYPQQPQYPPQQAYPYQPQANMPLNVNVNTSVYPQVSVQKNSSLGPAALVCGILGLCGGAIPVVQYFTFILSILAIAFGSSAKKKAKQTGQPTGMATGGMVLGIIAVILTIIMVVLTGAFYYQLFSDSMDL
ncbi:MAG: DUF4190 domain-containing protein [Treponema sp.]|jgi:hypothetical protein|nr:DUF4190 domain-containing protein [Treponema sp.]